MTDAELRALVRDAVARHVPRPAPAGHREPVPRLSTGSHTTDSHPSHHLYLTVVNSGDACVIEPSVTCDHCGYCRSHGH